MCFLSRPSGSPEFIIDREGISMDPDRVKAVQGWPAPELVHDIHVFWGLQISIDVSYLVIRELVLRSLI